MINIQISYKILIDDFILLNELILQCNKMKYKFIGDIYKYIYSCIFQLSELSLNVNGICYVSDILINIFNNFIWHSHSFYRFKKYSHLAPMIITLHLLSNILLLIHYF